MGRLTDRKTAEDLKANVNSLQALGIEPNMSDLRYIKLAEYENAEEFIETTTHAPVLSYQTAAIKAVLEGKGVKCKVNVIDKPKADGEPVKYGKWIKGKDWDEWFCSVCHKRAYLDCKENPILSDYCPHCGVKNNVKYEKPKLYFCNAKQRDKNRNWKGRVIK